MTRQCRFKGWLYRSVIQYWREHKVEQGSPSLLKAGREQQLELLIAKLPEMERLIFLLRYGVDCSYEEIAEIMQMPVYEVQTQLDVTKQQIRNQVRGARR